MLRHPNGSEMSRAPGPRDGRPAQRGAPWRREAPTPPSRKAGVCRHRCRPCPRARLLRHRRPAAVTVPVPGAVGSPDVDCVAQRQRALVDRVAPCAHRRHRRQAHDEAVQHHAAPRLDPLRQRRFALAGEKRGTPHVVQAQRHRIVGAVEIITGGIGCGGSAGRRRSGVLTGLADPGRRRCPARTVPSSRPRCGRRRLRPPPQSPRRRAAQPAANPVPPWS